MLADLDRQVSSLSGLRRVRRELTLKDFRASAAPPEASHSRGERDAGWADAVGGDEKDRTRHRVRGIGDEDRDHAAAHHAGLDRDPPSAAELREYDRMIGRFTKSHHARACLFQVLIGRNLREHGRLQVRQQFVAPAGFGQTGRRESIKAR